MGVLQDRVEKVRSALYEAGKDLHIDEWKSLLEEIGAEVDGQLDALREEEENDADLTPTDKPE